MKKLLDRIGNHVNSSCLEKGSLNKEGCKVVMTGISQNRLVIDFDKPGSPLPAQSVR